MSQSPNAGAFNAGFQAPRPPMIPPVAQRYSAAAITAFVAALVPCCYVHVLVALICSAVGISATSRGRARGRGWAVVAIPIALILGLLETGAAFGFYKFGKGFLTLSVAAGDLFKHSGAELDSAAASLYDATMTSAFKGKVTREQFQAWAQAVVAKHGTFVEIEPSQNMSRSTGKPQPDGSYLQQVDLRAKFAGGSETLTLIISFKWRGGLDFDFLLDDISVGNLSASEFPQKSPAPPSSPAATTPAPSPPGSTQPGSGRP